MDILFAFGLTLFAGLATVVGGLLAFFKTARNPKVLAIALGFSAGVMIYVSFVEILPKGVASMTLLATEQYAWAIGVVSFFGGFALTALIDKILPSHHVDETANLDMNKKRLLRLGLFSAIAITIHNFPEGFATFMAALEDPTLGIAIAVAIAIHNIPEGIAVSIPVLHATNSKKKALWYSSISGLAEPVGALVGYLVLSWLFNDWLFGILFAAVAGIMVYISIDELLPSAHLQGDHHHVIYGFAAGMLVMAISLVLFV